MKVSIQHLSLTSLGKMGCLLGVIAAFLPSLLCGIGAFALVGVIARWLAGWQDLTLSVLGQEIARIDLVRFFSLDGVLVLLQQLTAASAPLMLLSVLGMALVAGVMLAVIIMLTGLAYNLLAKATGGVVVEMSPVSPKETTSTNTRD